MKEKIITSCLVGATLLYLLAVASLGADVTVSVSVLPYIDVTPEYTAVDFQTLDAGTSNNPAPNLANGIYNFTVDTNKNYKVEAYGTDFSGATSSFAISNLKLDTDSDKANLALANAVALSTTSQTIDTNIAYTNTVNYHGYWLTIPSGQYAEAYSSTVTVTITNV